MFVSLLLDFVWLPFFREIHQAYVDAKESPSRAFPLLEPEQLAPHLPIAQRLQNAFLSSLRAHFSSSSAPPPPPPVAHSFAPVAGGAASRALGESNLL